MELNPDEWRRQGRAFDRTSHVYHDARPGYPRKVFDLLRERCGLGRGSKVLEVGAGPGQATMPMLDMGAHVTAVEPGANLADLLIQHAAGKPLRVIVATFEHAVVEEESSDLVVSATAFHWVDTAVGLAKAAAALHDQGWLALWWTVFGDLARPDPFHDALQPILQAKAQELVTQGSAAMSYALDVRARSREIEDSGFYEPVEHHLVQWEGRHGAEEIRRLFSTFSAWIKFPEDRRTDLLADIERLARDTFGGIVVRPYQTALYLARRRTR
jgi:SAM-dependent methyltransferase